MANVQIDKKSYTVDSLYQWDINQELVIYGLSLATIPEIHFTNDAMDKAIVRQATMDNAGVIRAEIPNSMLQKPYKIRAYVCIYEGDTFKSLYLITIPVNARSMPTDYTITVSDDEIYSFNALENKLENTLALSLARYDEVNQKYNEAANVLAETIINNSSAANSANTASTKANEAKTSETNASASAESALYAKDVAETARTNAESARDKALEYMKVAEDAMEEAVNAKEAIDTAIDTYGQLNPLFANSIDECTDTNMLYVLPDGLIYGYMKKLVTVEHNANDGSGSLNARATGTTGTSKNDNTARNGLFTTAPIAVDNTWSSCVVTIRGIEKLVPAYYASLYVYYFDANGNYIAYLGNGPLGITETSEEEITLPLSFDLSTAGLPYNYWSQCSYIRITLCVKMDKVAITDSDIENLVINVEPLNTTESVYGWYSTGHAFIPADYEDRIVNLENDSTTIKNDIKNLNEKVNTSPSNSGAVWYAVGDSITKGYGVGADNCWVKYVMQYNGYDSEKSKNLGISGLGFAKTDPNYGKTARSVVDENDFSGVDLVTIAIGINDWKEPFSLETVTSEMSYCFDKILTDNPYCKIIFITPFNMRNKGAESTNWALGYSGSDVTGGTLQNFINAQKSVCEQYGIQVIDMTNNSVINKKNISTLLYDGIHPDAKCHKALGRELSRRITFA